jgi:hypothetical protein
VRFVKRNLFSKNNIVKALLGLIIVIYIIFLYLDILTRDLSNTFSIVLKYSIIILCCIITLFIGRDYVTKGDKYLVQIARGLTLAADYYLLIESDFKTGILFFCFVQATYIIRHTINSKSVHKNILALALMLLAANILVVTFDISYLEEGLVKLALIYASLLVTSLFCALQTIGSSFYKKGESYLIALGMLLFFLCDVNVGLLNFISDVSREFLTGYLIWLFYTPSQLLLSLSGFNESYLKRILNFEKVLFK